MAAVSVKEETMAVSKPRTGLDIRVIQLSSITGAGYQRQFRQAKAEAIASDFREEECGVLVVTDQGDGTFTGTDGQHRLWALRKLGYTEWPCQVLAQRSLAREARTFVDVNTKRTALVGADRWRARRMAEEPLVLEVEAIVKSLGLVIDQDAHGDWRIIRATAALERVHRTIGADHLADTLRVIGNAWPGDLDAYKADVILGVSSFLIYYANDRHFMRGELVGKLSAVPLRTLLQRAALSHANPSGAAEVAASPGMVRALVGAYNHRRRTHLLEEPTLSGWRTVSKELASRRASQSA